MLKTYNIRIKADGQCWRIARCLCGPLALWRKRLLSRKIALEAVKITRRKIVNKRRKTVKRKIVLKAEKTTSQGESNGKSS